MTVPVPDIGDFKEVEVIEVLVKPGDTVTKEQSLITLESDKATMEIPSPAAGVVKDLKIKVGDKISKGAPILVLEGCGRMRRAQPSRAGRRPPPAPSAGNPGARADTRRPRFPREPRDEAVAKPHASPSVRKFARELGVDLARVPGSGPKGRILHSDVQAFVKGVIQRKAPLVAKGGGALPFNLPAWPEVDFAKFGPIELKPLSRIQKISGPYLHRNWISIPHVTHFDEADITDLEAFRKAQTVETEKKGFKLTMLAFMIKACVTALKHSRSSIPRSTGRARASSSRSTSTSAWRSTRRAGWWCRWCATPDEGRVRHRARDSATSRRPRATRGQDPAKDQLSQPCRSEIRLTVPIRHQR